MFQTLYRLHPTDLAYLPFADFARVEDINHLTRKLLFYLEECEVKPSSFSATSSSLRPEQQARAAGSIGCASVLKI